MKFMSLNAVLSTNIFFAIIVSFFSIHNAYSIYLRKANEPVNHFHNFTPISTERLILRPFEDKDVNDFFKLMSDPEVINQTTALELLHTKKEVEDLIGKIKQTYAADFKRGWMVIGIVEKQSNTLIGYCGFFSYTPTFARAELGYALAKEYWGKGYITEATRALLDFGFNVMKLNRIEATVFPENPGSIRVLEKLGMEYEGILRQHISRNGVFRDRLMYSVLKSEWKK